MVGPRDGPLELNPLVHLDHRNRQWKEGEVKTSKKNLGDLQ